MEIGILILLFGLLMATGQAIFAYQDSFLTVSQMKGRGFNKGLPLVAHAGIWGDLFVLTPLLAVIVASYSDRWSFSAITISVIIGIASTVIMGLIWVNGAKHGLPEAHTHEGKMTVAGYIHGIFMAAAIAGIILFFFYSGISRKDAIIVSIILAFHFIYGTHIVLGLFHPSWYPDRPHKQVTTWALILVVYGLLAWRCITI